MSPENNRERWPATVSVALIMVNGDGSLLLVHKRKTDQWSLPAGGLQKGENGEQAAFREAREETGLGPDDFERPFLINPDVLFITGNTKTSVGLLYIMRLKVGWREQRLMSDSNEEVDLVRPFSRLEIEKLLDHPETIYKPEFNKFALERALNWLVDF